jgi:RNA polymerase sigma-70 factor (ECF subfamily)
MIRVAMAYVTSRAAAEEAVQEAWIAVIRGIDGFEARSSLKTWIFRILTNVALRSGARERRSVPFSSLAEREDAGEPSVDPDRFLPPEHARFPGHWAIMPTRWPTPEEGLLAGETRDVIAAAIAELPVAQRTVIALRDIEGWSSDEVCEVLRRRGRDRDRLSRGLAAPGRAHTFERHLATCPGCTEYVEQMRTLAGSIGGVTEESLPPELRAGLIAAFRERHDR